MTLLPPPPAYGMALGEAGRVAVFLAIAAFLGSAATWLFPAPRKLASGLFWAGSGLVLVTIGIHVALLLTRQYEFNYVWEHTRDNMPFAYRLSGAWAGQEGSFLLWVTTSAVIAALAARSTGNLRRWYTVICSLALVGMLGIVAYESPFKLIPLDKETLAALPLGQTMLMPPDGQGLNPALQNYWMVIHPWVIFTGFGSLLALFGWAASAAFSRDWKSWANAARPWAIFSATVLGVGLTMGGLWAYETLGWGGFWAWDPVENVSLVPFIAASVLIHTLYVQSTRSTWSRWNLVLGVLPFLWFAYGTFLTRSGALVNVSVHSFAEMNKGAHGLLMGLVIATAALVLVVAGIAIFARRSEEEPVPPGHRSVGMAVGMYALYAVGIAAAIGMSVPFLAAAFKTAVPTATGGSNAAAVAEQVYDRIVLWPFVPALLLMGIAPLLGWTKTLPGNWNRAVTILYGCFFLAAFPLVPIMTRTMKVSPWVMLAILLSVWACLASVVSNTALAIQRRKNLGAIGAFVTHTGVALLLLGLIVSHAFERTGQAAITAHSGSKIEAGPLKFTVAMQKPPTVEDLLTPENPLALLLVDSKGRHLEMKPTVYYSVGSMGTGEPQLVSRPSILRSAFYDTYLSVTSRETELAQGIDLSEGETKSVALFEGVQPVKFSYLKKTVVGSMGQPGTKFVVQLLIDMEGESYKASPEIAITETGMEHRDVQLPNGLGVRLEMLRASDGTATISLLRPEAVYFIELFFKPLTILVWLGAALMTLGGAMNIVRLARRPGTSPPA
jgi:cytochrome c-type biogenesis protein CcmF